MGVGGGRLLSKALGAIGCIKRYLKEYSASKIISTYPFMPMRRLLSEQMERCHLRGGGKSP